MKKLRLWLMLLSGLLWVTVWTGSALAQVDDPFVPQLEWTDPEESHGSGQKETGKSALVDSNAYSDSVEVGRTSSGLFGSTSANPDGANPGGFWSWAADHGLGLMKGIGAGLIGAAVVGAGAVLLSLGTPVVLTVAGAALLGGAIYGLMVGSVRFNWAEAIVGSIIGGVSAGVGSWLSATASAITAKIGIAVTNVTAGGLTSLASYLINAPERTWGGALGAFAFGSVASGVFMGIGAAASRLWNWGKGALGLSAKGQSANSMVTSALPDSPGALPESLPGQGTAAQAGAAEAPLPPHRLPGTRPSWRQSELDVGKDLAGQGFEAQKSFKNGVEVPYGTKGSVRPEYVRPGLSIEVKNYDITSAAGRSRLVRNVVQQAQKRVEHLPEGTVQRIIIDVRGQDVSDEVLDELARRIAEKSGGILQESEILFRM